MKDYAFSFFSPPLPPVQTITCCQSGTLGEVSGRPWPKLSSAERKRGINLRKALLLLLLGQKTMCPCRPSPRLLKLEMVTTTKVCYSSTRLPYEPSVQRWGNKKHTHLPSQHLKPIWACNNRRVMHHAPPTAPSESRRPPSLLVHDFAQDFIRREKKNLSHLFHITLTMTDHVTLLRRSQHF